MQVLLDVSEYQTVAQLDRLLTSADDTIVGVYIKATQGLSYRDALADAFAHCCIEHKTPFGFYDFMTNDQAANQEEYFQRFLDDQRLAELIPFLDCEGSYAKGAAGFANWQRAYGKKTALYAQLSNMPQYAGLTVPKFVAQYDRMAYYRPSVSEIQTYQRQGYAAWQFTSKYCDLNQDAYVLLVPLEELKST